MDVFSLAAVQHQEPPLVGRGRLAVPLPLPCPACLVICPRQTPRLDKGYPPHCSWKQAVHRINTCFRTRAICRRRMLRHSCRVSCIASPDLTRGNLDDSSRGQSSHRHLILHPLFLSASIFSYLSSLARSTPPFYMIAFHSDRFTLISFY